jgi:hypothetical protein
MPAQRNYSPSVTFAVDPVAPIERRFHFPFKRCVSSIPIIRNSNLTFFMLARLTRIFRSGMAVPRLATMNSC